MPACANDRAAAMWKDLFVPNDATITNPLAGHIVRFPTAIPTEQWMADRMLWADQIGAVWPFDQQPTPTSVAEHSALAAAHAYKDADFFTECVVPSKAFHSGAAAALGMTTKQLQEWARFLPAGDDEGPAEAFRTPREAYFYINKLGNDVCDVLVEAGIADRTDNNFIKLKSATAARRLMATIATSARPAGGGERALTLDAADDKDLAAAAAPAEGDPTYAAKVVNLPVVTAALHTDAQRIIDFRSSNRNERARKDYLAAVEAHVATEVFTITGDYERDPALADRIRAEKIRRDLIKATQGLVKEHGAAGLTGFGASAVSALVAVPQVADGSIAAVSAAAGVTGLAAAGIHLLRGSRDTRYLRRGQAAEIFGRPVPPTLG